MSGPDEDCNDPSESTTVTNPFAKESPFEAALADFDNSEFVRVTDELATSLTEEIRKWEMIGQSASQILEAFGEVPRERLIHSLSEMDSGLDEVREMIKDLPNEPSTHMSQAAINPPTPAVPKKTKKRPELSTEEAEELLEDSGVMVTCDGCGHPYLQVNAHRMLTNEGGKRLCGRCRDASRGIQ